MDTNKIVNKFKMNEIKDKKNKYIKQKGRKENNTDLPSSVAKNRYTRVTAIILFRQKGASHLAILPQEPVEPSLKFYHNIANKDFLYTSTPECDRSIYQPLRPSENVSESGKS